MTKIQKYENNDLFVNIVSRIESVKSALWMKEGGEEELSVAPAYDISNINVSYLAALKNRGITQNNTEEITEFDTALCPTYTFSCYK